MPEPLHRSILQDLHWRHSTAILRAARGCFGHGRNGSSINAKLTFLTRRICGRLAMLASKERGRGQWVLFDAKFGKMLT